MVLIELTVQLEDNGNYLKCVFERSGDLDEVLVSGDGANWLVVEAAELCGALNLASRVCIAVEKGQQEW